MKKLIKHFVFGEDADIYTSWFITKFESKHFREMDRLFWHFLEFCSQLGIGGEKRNLEIFLKTTAKNVIMENNIKLGTMDPFDYSDPTSLEEAFRIIRTAMVTFYDEAVAVSSEDSFKLDMFQWIEQKQKEALQNVLKETAGKFNTGDMMSEVILDAEAVLHDISRTFDKRVLNELDFIRRSSRVSLDTNKSGDGEFLFKTGIECIDGIEGGVFSERLITLEGLSGSGKSRLAFKHFGYIPAVYAGIGVRIDSQELTKSQVENMLIAMHIITKFNGQVKIPDALMNGNGLDDEAMRYYLAAKEDLFNNPAYGKIYIFEGAIYVEEYERDVMSFLRQHKDVRMVINDYAGYSLSKPEKFKSHKPTPEIIEELYRGCKEMIGTAKVSFLIINQYNKEGAQKAKAGKSIDQGDIQGGQSVERYTLMNLYMTQTEEQKLAGIFNLSCSKARFGTVFFGVPMEAQLPVSYFKQRRREVNS